MRQTFGSTWWSMTCATCRRRSWPACTEALGEAVRREMRRGSQVRYLQRTDVPEEQPCLCLFEAAGPEVVRGVNDLAQFPLARVVAVLSSAPSTTPMADLEDDGH
jgi:hypothetical protein